MRLCPPVLDATVGTKIDDNIAPRRSALNGSDLWVEKRVEQCFFVSGRLAKALIDAGLKRDFRLRDVGSFRTTKCRRTQRADQQNPFNPAWCYRVRP